MKLRKIFLGDERTTRVSEEIQSEGFMILVVLINIIVLVKIGLFNGSFFDYKEISATVSLVSLYAGIKSAMNGAVRGTKAMYNIILCIITPMVMGMAWIAEIVKNNELGLGVYFLSAVPILIIVVTALILLYAEKMWERNNS